MLLLRIEIIEVLVTDVGFIGNSFDLIPDHVEVVRINRFGMGTIVLHLGVELIEGGRNVSADDQLLSIHIWTECLGVKSVEEFTNLLRGSEHTIVILINGVEDLTSGKLFWVRRSRGWVSNLVGEIINILVELGVKRVTDELFKRSRCEFISVSDNVSSRDGIITGQDLDSVEKTIDKCNSLRSAEGVVLIEVMLVKVIEGLIGKVLNFINKSIRKSDNLWLRDGRLKDEIPTYFESNQFSSFGSVLPSPVNSGLD